MMPQGMLKPYILFLVSKRPMHGFEMIEEIEDRSHGIWKSGPAAVYPSIEWLKKEGYIEPAWHGRKSEKARRQYRITRKGRDVIRNYKEFEKEWFGNLKKLTDLFK